MLQGDAIREITLEGPGAGGTETASAVVADLVSVVGTAGTGFLQNDACWRELERLDPSDWRSPFYVHLDVADRPGVLAHAASSLAAHEVSVAQLVQRLGDGQASLDLVLHEAPSGRSTPRSTRSQRFPEVLDRPFVAPVVRTGRCDRHARRGQHAAAAGAAPVRAARRRALAQMGGREPDRLVQGPGHERRRRRRRSRTARTRSSARRPATRPLRAPRMRRGPGSRR